MQSELHVDMQRCGAYEVLQLSKQRIVMEEILLMVKLVKIKF